MSGAKGQAEASLLSHYRKLHDGLSDMIESGRGTRGGRGNEA